MNTNAAYRLARELMKEHGIGNWTFEFDRAYKRAGHCRHGDTTITMSRQVTAAFTEEEVRDTILHEIAHALAGPSHGHDRYWRAIFLSIGGNGRTTYTASDAVKAMEAEAARYSATCSGCGHTYKVLRRRKNFSKLTCGDRSCVNSLVRTTKETRVYLVWYDNETKKRVSAA